MIVQILIFGNLNKTNLMTSYLQQRSDLTLKNLELEKAKKAVQIGDMSTEEFNKA